DEQTLLLGTGPAMNICVLGSESRKEGDTGTEGVKSRRDAFRKKSRGKPTRGKTTGIENSVILVLIYERLLWDE
ncbi:MAG: hypothetical protein GY696_17770, partial [Gammaproteobacteria bacterium]|nr:hypothetical protein [Gammaproteobacteria bacterium]